MSKSIAFMFLLAAGCAQVPDKAAHTRSQPSLKLEGGTRHFSAIWHFKADKDGLSLATKNINGILSILKKSPENKRALEKLFKSGVSMHRMRREELTDDVIPYLMEGWRSGFTSVKPSRSTDSTPSIDRSRPTKSPIVESTHQYYWNRREETIARVSDGAVTIWRSEKLDLESWDTHPLEDRYPRLTFKGRSQAIVEMDPQNQIDLSFDPFRIPDVEPGDVILVPKASGFGTLKLGSNLVLVDELDSKDFQAIRVNDHNFDYQIVYSDFLLSEGQFRTVETGRALVHSRKNGETGLREDFVTYETKGKSWELTDAERQVLRKSERLWPIEDWAAIIGNAPSDSLSARNFIRHLRKRSKVSKAANELSDIAKRFSIISDSETGLQIKKSSGESDSDGKAFHGTRLASAILNSWKLQASKSINGYGIYFGRTFSDSVGYSTVGSSSKAKVGSDEIPAVLVFHKHPDDGLVSKDIKGIKAYVSKDESYLLDSLQAIYFQPIVDSRTRKAQPEPTSLIFLKGFKTLPEEVQNKLKSVELYDDFNPFFLPEAADEADQVIKKHHEDLRRDVKFLDYLDNFFRRW